METTDMFAIGMVWLYLLLSYLLIVACVQLGGKRWVGYMDWVVCWQCFCSGICYMRYLNRRSS